MSLFLIFEKKQSQELTRVNPDQNNVELTFYFFTLQMFDTSPSPNFKYQILDTRYQILDTIYQIQDKYIDTRHQILDTRHQILDTRCYILDTRYQILYQVLDIRYQIIYIRYYILKWFEFKVLILKILFYPFLRIYAPVFFPKKFNNYVSLIKKKTTTGMDLWPLQRWY